MIFPLIIIRYLVVFQAVRSEKQIELQLIKNYIEKQVSFPSVSCILCWDFEDIQTLSKILNTNNIKGNILNKPREHITFPKLNNNLFIIDMSCDFSIKILKQANAGFNFRVPNHWLILQNHSYQLSINKTPQNTIFNELNLFVDTQLIVAQQLQNQEFVLQYLYKLDKNSSVIVDQFARWTFEKGFSNFEMDALSWRRRNLGLHTIRISMVITDNSSFEHMTDYRQNEMDAPTKLNYILTNSLLNYINASKKIMYYSTWYNHNSNDQNGTLIGSILNRDIDITGTPFFCKPERLSWMDCIAMTTPVEGFFIFRQPPLSYVKNIYILPFGTDLWLTDISFFFLSAFLLYLVIIWEWRVLEENEDKPEVDMIHATVSDSLLFTMGAVCQQGYATEPKGTPGKILILTVFITLIFLFTAYTAYTVVLFQATADDIKSLKDLYESEIVLGLEDKPYIRELFPKYTEPLRKKIYYEKIAPKGQQPHYYPLKEGIAKMRNEYFAFHIDQISGYKVIHDTFLESEKCGLREISYLFENNPWIVSPKNIPFKEIFTIGYRKLTESGLFRREIKKRISQKPACSSQGNNFRSAGILDLYSVYLLLIIGVICSILILILEIIIYKFTKQYRNNQKNTL